LPPMLIELQNVQKNAVALICQSDRVLALRV
jgi:hypothetical protein